MTADDIGGLTHDGLAGVGTLERRLRERRLDRHAGVLSHEQREAHDAPGALLRVKRRAAGQCLMLEGMAIHVRVHAAGSVVVVVVVAKVGVNKRRRQRTSL